MDDTMTMRDAWAEQAQHWLQLVERELDAGWAFSKPRFLDLLPPPSGLTLDVGCGEGRLGRALAERGYRVVGVDVTWAFASAASKHRDRVPVAVADAARLPVPDRTAALVVAFMSLLDIDDYVGAIAEAGRVLVRGGRFCFAIVHPIAESGRFLDDGSFVLTRSYMDTWRYPDHLGRHGVEMTFHSEHRPLEAYARALEDAGLVIEAVREPRPDDREVSGEPQEERWRRVPNFLMVRARTAA